MKTNGRDKASWENGRMSTKTTLQRNMLGWQRRGKEQINTDGELTMTENEQSFNTRDKVDR